MKKVTYFLVFALISFFSFANFNSASADMKGKELYSSCSSCHNSQKRNLAGKPADVLVKKFNAIQAGDFKSGARKKMKDLFMSMSDSDKVALAKYLNMMK